MQSTINPDALNSPGSSIACTNKSQLLSPVHRVSQNVLLFTISQNKQCRSYSLLRDGMPSECAQIVLLTTLEREP